MNTPKTASTSQLYPIPDRCTHWTSYAVAIPEQLMLTMETSGKYFIYHGLLMPNIAHSEESIKYAMAFEVQDEDVFAITYPKSGTTWMQEILPPILNGGDLTSVRTIPNWDRVPWLEETRAALVLGDRPPPRAMVSHLPYHLMPPSFYTSKAKVIYVTRNPKDIAVSSFHFHKMASFLDDPGTFDEFLDKFLSGQVLFGKWTDHVKSWRNTDIEDRILYVTYEEMVQEPLETGETTSVPNRTPGSLPSLKRRWRAPFLNSPGTMSDESRRSDFRNTWSTSSLTADCQR
ncbi:sulfotransferase family 2, cytosolic sulfotransferase 3 isoform X3 [Anguilla rostrata]|uniref:sulfotransferase family 2, cytosolic sulfotransferase 3 isoform X3 n=1 Tax=Anguilla rostrata TaxID=7938 RepID=UPI0030CD3F4C